MTSNDMRMQTRLRIALTVSLACALLYLGATLYIAKHFLQP